MIGRYIAAFKRRQYRGSRPSRWARIENRLSAILFARGILPDRAAALEIRGRKSGRLISFPVAIAEHEGDRYLVAMLGARTNWVLNVRAGDGRAVLRHGRREEIRLVEETADRRAEILRRFLQTAPGARPHFPIDQHATPDEFRHIMDRYPVFRITSPLATP